MNSATISVTLPSGQGGVEAGYHLEAQSTVIAILKLATTTEALIALGNGSEFAGKAMKAAKAVQHLDLNVQVPGGMARHFI
jgi:hypothetical protein